jgi:hypothetical protein
MDNQDNDRNNEINIIQHEGIMKGLTENSEENIIGKYPSDGQDKQATEATGDITHLKPLKKDSDEAAMKICSNVESSQDLNEIPVSEPASDNGSGAVPNLSVNTEPIDSSSAIIKESPGVLDTNQQNGNSLSNQRKPITTQDIAFDKKIFISYSHSQQDLCLEMQRVLKNEGFHVWIDEYCVEGDILKCIAEGIENALVFLMVINEQYYQSFYCQAEAEYAFELRKKNDSNFSASEL